MGRDRWVNWVPLCECTKRQSQLLAINSAREEPHDVNDLAHCVESIDGCHSDRHCAFTAHTFPFHYCHLDYMYQIIGVLAKTKSAGVFQDSLFPFPQDREELVAACCSRRWCS